MSEPTTEPKFRWKRSLGGFGRVKFMAKSDGYVMVRYPRCMPFIMTEKDWLVLPATEPVGESADAE